MTRVPEAPASRIGRPRHLSGFFPTRAVQAAEFSARTELAEKSGRAAAPADVGPGPCRFLGRHRGIPKVGRARNGAVDPDESWSEEAAMYALQARPENDAIDMARERV